MTAYFFKSNVWIIGLFLLCGFGSGKVFGQKDNAIIVGAEQPSLYMSRLEGKRVGVLVNQTSLVKGVHLIDFLLKNEILVKKIFAAEHGIRGLADAGEHIDHGVDLKTGIPIVSLHGTQKKPTNQQMSDLDVLVFDVQDVGCRFYTYISTMHYLMEACAENQVLFIVLDRPNPNGDYVGGPVLDMSLTSFVGMHPIPIVHGLTVGELALMINGELWLDGKRKVDLHVVPVLNYTHSTLYELPVKPSPNLPNYASVRLYPSLCLFEASHVSIGRGTLFPFQVIGFPRSDVGKFSFTPVSIDGMSKNPPQQNMICYGDDLRQLEHIPPFTLSFFLDFYKRINNEAKFWSSRRWIDLLVGDKQFYELVNKGLSAYQIEQTWQEGINEYKIMRKKYLLYTDFE